MPRGPTPAALCLRRLWRLGDNCDDFCLVHQLRNVRPDLQASAFFFSYADNTPTKSLGAAFNTLTSCTIGALSRNSSFAYSSGLPGSVARSVTSAALMARP